MLFELYCKEQAERDVEMKNTDELIKDEDPDYKSKPFSLTKLMQSLEQMKGIKGQQSVDKFETKD